MDYRHFYRHLATEEVAYLADNGQLVGRYREKLRPLDAIPNALEWFVGLSEFRPENVRNFISKYGLLRWNWTHGGWTGDQTSTSSQFYFSVRDFRESHAKFQENWAIASKRGRKNRTTVCEWLREQLDRRPMAMAVSEWSEMWKLAQPQIGMRIQPHSAEGIEVHIVAGDLWQALCWAFLEKLTEETGLIRVCKNPRCKGPTYFVGRRKYCDPHCGKLVADRKYVNKKRGTRRRISRPSKG